MPVLRIASLWDGAPARADEAVEVRLSDDGDRVRIDVDAPYHGDPPPPGPPGATFGLWEYEVVEVFVAGPPDAEGRVPYTEIEVGPHGHHLVLRLLGVRQMTERELPLTFSAAIEGDRWTGTASIDRSLLPAGPRRVNAYAIHGVGDARRYLAWTPVPGPRPDFHQPARFRPVPI